MRACVRACVRARARVFCFIDVNNVFVVNTVTLLFYFIDILKGPEYDWLLSL